MSGDIGSGAESGSRPFCSLFFVIKTYAIPPIAARVIRPESTHCQIWIGCDPGALVSLTASVCPMLELTSDCSSCVVAGGVCGSLSGVVGDTV